MAEDKPIIVVKKKGGHAGHHGGAWKVAYADFVTAMMAFFLVMWLVNSAESPTRESIASYFRNPGIFHSGSGAPLQTGSTGILLEGHVPYHTQDQGYLPGEGGDIIYDDVTREILERLSAEERRIFLEELDTMEESFIEEEMQTLEGVADEIMESFESSPEMEGLADSIDIQLRSDGLHIEIMDTDDSSMFALASSNILPEARAAFLQIARSLEELPNKIDIVGHTDSRPFSSKQNGYSNWELSAERANAARRLLETEGNMTSDRISSVVGRADRQLRLPEDPEAASNRRISMLVRFNLEGLERLKDPSFLENLAVEQGEALSRLKKGETPIRRRGSNLQTLIRLARESELAESQKEEPPDFVIPRNPVIGPPDLFTDF